MAIVLAGVLALLCGAGAPPAAAAPEQAAPSSRIETDALGAVATDAAGALTEAEGGLPPDMWRGTPRSLVAAMLPRLPVATPSPAMRSLMRRLLLSAAAPPAGEGAAGTLLGERAWMLWRMGDLDGLLRLIAAVPADRRSSWLVRLEAEARLILGDGPAACRLAQAQIGEDSDSFWQRLQGFCHAQAGEVEDAELAVALLVDRGEDVRSYAALIGAITGTGGTLPKLPDPSPLEIAMLRAAKGSPAPEAAAEEELPLALGIAESPEFQDGLRLAAAERAVAAGVLPAGRLRPLFQRVPPGKPAQSSARGGRAESPDAAVQPLVRRAFASEEPMARAEATVLALDAGRRSGRYLATARALMPELASYGPGPELVGYAQHLVPAMLAMGERPLAAAWMSWLGKQAPLAPVADAATSLLMPLARLAKLPQAADWQQDSLFPWWQAERSRPGGRQRAVRLFVLLRATGETVPDEAWMDLLDGPAQQPGTAIDPAFRTQLMRAARAKRIGQTALLALIALGTDGPEAIDPAGLETVVDSLRIAGLESVGRAIAVEAMAAAR